ncbi:NB-ARC domain disease resistance protein [Medicago truncatula]|uniref:NB-ARC domain disease resistance protein n=1 Tax=Medicago truncatula TaxID=3880 RepID=A0A072VT31_MEDTR|nr:NB-ARC domain disease resistance protein [Medicago truncatula]
MHIIIKIINFDSAASNFDSASASIVVHQENINHFDIEQLQSRLRRKLYGKRFLLVLDDIWNDDCVKWIELKDLIKVGTVGSKVMATTRSNSIASMMGTVPSYVLKGLSIENCLSLFVKWAFKEGEEDKYPNLVEIGKEIVKKCAGVPLVVRTLGSCLFSKFDLNKWELARDSEMWTLEQKQNDILPALKLSYDKMPSYLRHCFAYIAMYPKDHTFYAVEFNNLWTVLGLVQSRNGSEMQEDIVREYINELNSRSFLQDFKDFGYFCKFKVHDLVHDLAFYVAKKEFVVVKSHILRLPERVKHLSIVENVSICDSLFPKSRSVRTILFLIKVSNPKYKDETSVYWGFPELLSLPEWIVGASATLATLEITNFPNLKMFLECLTTMSHLKRLYIIDCPQVLSLPCGMHRLTTLDDLRIYGCPELYRKYRRRFGEYWPMISHIKHVFIGEPRGEGE